MSPPDRTPIGLQLTRTAKALSRAFDARLVKAGGSLPIWLVLLSLHTQQLGTQRALAEAIGIQSATLTHHLNAMENNGLLTRRRDPTNRRVHLVELTPAGTALFDRLRTAALAHDQQLRSSLTPHDLHHLEKLLNQLHHTITGTPLAAPGSGTGMESTPCE